MRFLNWEATLRKARESGLMEGYAKGYIEGLALARAEARARGQSETNRAWAAWNQRREAAAERNEPFDEPPPSQTQG